jgi:hypothetical protein
LPRFFIALIMGDRTALTIQLIIFQMKLTNALIASAIALAIAGVHTNPL